MQMLGLIPLTIATDFVALARSDPTIFKLSKADLQSLKVLASLVISTAPKEWKICVFSATLILIETRK